MTGNVISFASPNPRSDLLLTGLLLAGDVFLGKQCWFSVPFRAIVLATLLYASGLIIVWA